VSRFRFRLQKVLELKEKSERSAASELARVQELADQARQSHAALAAMRHSGNEQMASAQGTLPTVGQLQNMGFVLAQLDQHVDQAANGAATAQSVVDGARAELTAAHQARRVLDRLRDRRRDEWQTAESQADLASMDSLALTRFTKSNSQLPDA
jgi:flagellar FliJ protein